MTKWSCRDCLFRHPDNRPEYQGYGHCRKNPPVVVETVAFDGSGANHLSQHWPWVAPHDWCGGWKSNNIIVSPKLKEAR